MLHFAFEFHELLGQRRSSDGREIVNHSILVRINSINSIRHGSRIFNPLRETNQPVQSVFLVLIFDFDESLYSGDDRLDFIALGYFAGFNQDQVCEFFR